MKLKLLFPVLGSVFLCGLLLYSFSFFQTKQLKPDMQTINHLKVNLSEGDPPSLHPHLNADIRGRILGKSLFEGLTRLSKSGKGELAAASSVEIDPSQTLYTFTIRPHKWSNEEAVTAYHFERAWKEAIQPQSPCARADLFYIIKNAKKAKSKELPIDQVGVKAVDENTLLVELENPAPYFLELISHPMFSPLYNSDPEPTVFNGPFKIARWERGVVLEFDKNENYWDAASVKLDKASIFMVADVYTEYSLFEKGMLDIVGDCFDSFPQDVLPSAMKDGRYNSQAISRIYWLYLNTAKFPFTSAKIRKAFAFALNRNDLTQNFLIGDSPCGTILPQTLSLIDQKESIDGNLHLAQELFEEGLQELGLTRENFPVITLSYCNYGSQKSLSELLQANFQKVLGIQVKIQNFEWNVLLSNMIQGEYELASCIRNAVYEDPLYFLEIFKEKNCSYNYSRWESPEYQELLSLAIEATDKDIRHQFLKQAEELLFNEMPVISVYTETCKYMVQENLKGYFINNSGYTDFKNLSFQ